MLQNFNIKIQKSNRNINISNISDLLVDVMCFHLKKKTMITLCQMNQQYIGLLKQLDNKIGANVMTLYEGPEVNDKIKKI